MRDWGARGSQSGQEGGGQAEQVKEKDETIRALREQLKRYQAAKANNIRDEIFDENDNMI